MRQFRFENRINPNFGGVTEWIYEYIYVNIWKDCNNFVEINSVF